MSETSAPVALDQVEPYRNRNESLTERVVLAFPDVPAATVRAIVKATATQKDDSAIARDITDQLEAFNSSGELGLRQGLASLAQLAMGQRGLPDMLTHIAEFAVQAIPGADGVGLTLFQNDRQDTIVATAPFVQDVDTAQYEIGEGPCITAAKQGVSICSGSLSTDPAFPRFGREADRLGVHSALSLPLMDNGAPVGTMNVYAHRRNAFDRRAVELGELYALPASISVANAQTLAQAQRLAQQLQQAIDNATDEVTAAIDILLRPRTPSLSIL
jgi:GAF domain-containing protein